MDMPAFDCNELDDERVAPYNIRFKAKRFMTLMLDNNIRFGAVVPDNI